MCEVWLCWLCLEARRVIRSNGPRDPLSGSSSSSSNNSHDHENHGQGCVCVCVCVYVCVYVCVCVFSCFSHTHLCVILWTTAHPSPLSMGFSRQEYWSELPCSPPGDLPNPGIEPGSSALQADSLPSEPPGKPKNTGVVAFPFYRGSSQPKNQIRISCIAGGFFTS